MAAEMNKSTKIGIISCSGEEIPGGTVSRNAVRRVLESLRPQDTVTLCLPLFLAGNEGERAFARTHPVITIDGCQKQCAHWGTERHGGPVARALVVTDILGAEAAGCSRSLRRRTILDDKADALVAERIAAEVDALMAESAELQAAADSDAGALDSDAGMIGRDLDRLSETLRALADKTRLEIMTLLLEHGELCVCDLVGALGQTQSKVSRHLRYLYHAGLVKDRREGLWTHYRVSPDLTPAQAAIISALSQAVGEEYKQALHQSLERWFMEKSAGSPTEEQGVDRPCGQEAAAGHESEVTMVEVRIFGSEPPCAKCKQAEEEARKAAAQFPGQVRVEKLAAQSPEGVALGVVMTPAVVVNGRLISQGRVPKKSELEEIFRMELGG